MFTDQEYLYSVWCTSKITFYYYYMYEYTRHTILHVRKQFTLLYDITNEDENNPSNIL